MMKIYCTVYCVHSIIDVLTRVSYDYVEKARTTHTHTHTIYFRAHRPLSPASRAYCCQPPASSTPLYRTAATTSGAPPRCCAFLIARSSWASEHHRQRYESMQHAWQKLSGVSGCPGTVRRSSNLCLATPCTQGKQQ